MPRRLFVGLPLSGEFQEAVRNRQFRFQKLPLRLIKPHNLHLTLLPPWPEEDVPAAIEKFSAWEPDFLQVEGHFEKLEYGPDARRPRLIWISGSTPQSLFKLQKTLREMLEQKPEPRPLFLHVTVARLRTAEFQPLLLPRLPEAFRWREHFRSVVLYESKLRPAGVEYAKLLETPLSSKLNFKGER